MFFYVQNNENWLILVWVGFCDFCHNKGSVIFNRGYQGGAETLWEGRETFSIILWWYENFKSNFYGIQKSFT